MIVLISVIRFFFVYLITFHILFLIRKLSWYTYIDDRINFHIRDFAFEKYRLVNFIHHDSKCKYQSDWIYPLHSNKRTLMPHCSSVSNYLVDILLYFVDASNENKAKFLFCFEHHLSCLYFRIICDWLGTEENCWQSNIGFRCPSMNDRQV